MATTAQMTKAVDRLANLVALMAQPATGNTDERLQAEYDRLNALIGGLTAIRVMVEDTMMVPAIESIERGRNGLPKSCQPRDAYKAASKAIVAAEHGLMNIRDRRGWSYAYDNFGKGRAKANV